MVRIFVREPAVANGKLVLDHATKKRLVRVMRLQPGDEIEVMTSGKRWKCRLEAVTAGSAVAEILEEQSAAPPGFRITLAQAIPKGDRFEWLIEKATEIGVHEIVPLITERTIARPAGTEAKLQRWNKIAEQAAGQCENPFPPVIHAPASLAAFLKTAAADLNLLFHEDAPAEPLTALLDRNARSTNIVVGPEGGWTETESQSMEAAGYRRILLGPRVMRSETAGLVAAAILQYELGDLRQQ